MSHLNWDALKLSMRRISWDKICTVPGAKSSVYKYAVSLQISLIEKELLLLSLHSWKAHDNQQLAFQYRLTFVD